MSTAEILMCILFLAVAVSVLLSQIRLTEIITMTYTLEDRLDSLSVQMGQTNERLSTITRDDLERLDFKPIVKRT